MANEVVTRSNTNLPGFQSAEGFELLQRQAKMFTHSTLVPQQFQGEQNMGNAIIALEMATRMNIDPLVKKGQTLKVLLLILGRKAQMKL